jgi:enediyne biosynthesis protein E5
MTNSNGSLGRERPERLQALWRFAAAITILNVLGHSVLGFEQSWAQPLIALGTAYSVELVLEALTAWAERRRPHYEGGLGCFVNFLLPAHITGLAVAMLLYANERLWPIAFAAAVAIGSKVLVRIPTGHGTRHCLNPSNAGIAITLLLFPWVGIAPPYQFTENLSGVGDWLLPAVIIASGTFLNTRFTRKMPLILGWLGGFLLQAVLRTQLQGTPFVPSILPITGMAFLLFTFYMVTDPATTPVLPRDQLLFGAAVSATYGLLMLSHVVFGLFFSLLLVCSLRGLKLALLAALRAPADWPVPARVPNASSAVLEAAE